MGKNDARLRVRDYINMCFSTKVSKFYMVKTTLTFFYINPFFEISRAELLTRFKLMHVGLVFGNTSGNMEVKKVESEVSRNFSCDLCSYQGNSLPRHVREVHGNIKKHKCEVCSAKFSQKTLLTGHIKAQRPCLSRLWN